MSVIPLVQRLGWETLADLDVRSGCLGGNISDTGQGTKVERSFAHRVRDS